jgi:hypothetical protein
VQDKAFISTSLFKHFKFDRDYEALLRIYLPKGIYGSYVADISNRQSEQELLLLPNAFIKLNDNVGKYKKKREYIEGKPIYDCYLDYFEALL